MEPRRFLLEGASLDELRARIRAEHGADARIIAAERVTVGGIRGFFAKRHFEVTVEVPERRRRAAHARLDLQARLGIAALLDDADAAETRLQAGVQAGPEPVLSTASDDFAYLMDELTFQAEPHLPSVVLTSTRVRPADSPFVAAAGPGDGPAAAPSRSATLVPRPLSGHGDLIVLVGLPDAALQVARSMALAGAGEVLVAGAARSDDSERADDRRSALSARARGVERGQTGLVAFGLGGDLADSVALVAALAETLEPIGADQVWLVVEAGRKPSDTGRWAAALAAITQIDAIAVVGAATTGTPGTVDELGLPIGWIDGAPATAPATAPTVAPTVAGLPSLPGRADGSR